MKPNFTFKYVPEIPDSSCFMVYRNSEPQAVAIAEFYGQGYKIHPLREITFTDELLILEQAHSYWKSFFDPEFWNL